MFKLLTEEERRKVTRIYVTHRAIVMFSALVLVLVAGITGLLPSYILSNARQHEVLERTRVISSSRQMGDGLSLQAWLVETNRKLEVLSPMLDTDRPSDSFGQILDQKIDGVIITGFSWSRVKGKITLSVDGVARDREVLITFEDRITASGFFSAVALPISNLAKDKNIDFQIKLSP